MFAASREPEGTLRAEVLDLLEVRRPNLRPLAKWMADHGALLATIVAYDGEAEGVLVLPRVARALDPPTLEELRALKSVADGLAGACSRGRRRRAFSRKRTTPTNGPSRRTRKWSGSSTGARSTKGGTRWPRRDWRGPGGRLAVGWKGLSTSSALCLREVAGRTFGR